MEMSLNRGVQIEKKDFAGLTALQRAISNSCEAAELLLDRGTNFMFKMQDVTTAPDYIASRGHSTMLRLLLDRGAGPNTGNSKGVTAHRERERKCYLVPPQQRL